MRYLCLVYHDERKLDSLTKGEWEALVDAHLDYDDVLRESGHFVIGQALLPVETATTVRVRNGKLSVTDGPFAETKEQLSGIILIEARDLNEAIQVATRIPSAQLGTIEVRPARELTHSGVATGTPGRP
jgi:hypothetical protein